ncbi:fructose-6-phosphate aldolase [Haloplasma contractile]|uniref:Probable transaldolase n=1 Tax=Haloplasma contractile SSD-17B TaxID=1033810 RepID=U2FF41_9MOLU|nr:fructose-6-phosphate aldolase [Haloplasma contractile]ERJ11525.1 putative transaldolase protein [Haloplasma contractile SSD-17B]
MKFFIDTANIEEIREIYQMGIISGVTTNPSLVAKEGKQVKDVIEEIASLVDGPISGEVNSLDYENMLKEGREIASVHPNIVVKIPMTEDGMKVVNQLSKDGIKTNVTLIFSASQALIAARAGASYVSPFVGRVDDISNDGMGIIEDIADLFVIHGIETEIIAASIRHPMHVKDAALAGSDIATVPYDVLKKCFKHPLTDIGIEKFKAAYEGKK